MVSTNSNAQGVLFDPDRIHKTTAAYKDLLDFVVRLRNFAPFNAMLLQVQKLGLTYAASAVGWLARFDRKPKDGARPLLILKPFGPVALLRCDGRRGQRPATVLMPSPFTQRT